MAANIAQDHVRALTEGRVARPGRPYRSIKFETASEFRVGAGPVDAHIAH